MSKLNPICDLNSSLQCNVTYSFLGVKMWTSLESHSSAYHPTTKTSHVAKTLKPSAWVRISWFCLSKSQVHMANFLLYNIHFCTHWELLCVVLKISNSTVYAERGWTYSTDDFYRRLLGGGGAELDAAGPLPVFHTPRGPAEEVCSSVRVSSLLSVPTEPSMPNIFSGTATKKIKPFPRDPSELQDCHRVGLTTFILWIWKCNFDYFF